MRHDDWRAASRACSGGTILPFFPILIPYIEFVRRGIFKGGLHYIYKRFIVDFVKGEHQREADGRNHEKYRQSDRQESVKQETEAAPSSQIQKLLQCQRTEYFVFDIYKLWNLEAHDVKLKVKMQKSKVFTFSRSLPLLLGRFSVWVRFQRAFVGASGFRVRIFFRSGRFLDTRHDRLFADCRIHLFL